MSEQAAGPDRTVPPDQSWASAAEHPGWRRLLAAARRSLERTGGSLRGTISLGRPSEAERLVVIGVTGTHRSATAGRLAVRLVDLDTHLREAYGAGLAELVAATSPLRNRPGEAKQEALAREALLSYARDCRHHGTGWYEEWLAGMRRDGTLTRVIRAGVSFEDVVRVLDALPADAEPMPVFADRVLADPKALADGMLRGLVLRALVTWQGVAMPDNAERERVVWESAGVVPDDLASQVLVLGVPANGGPLGRWLTEAAVAGVPLRVTLHQLGLAPLKLHCEEIFVCENPAVLRAAAGRLGAETRPLVCTEGVPSTAVHTLLRAASAGTVIRWRNDFDWTGVRLTAAALARYRDAVTWRMTSDDYRSAAGAGPALVGVPAATRWDPTLADAMREAGWAVMEERLLDRLLADLAR